MKILILCTGNSCRSQMAEGLFKKYGGKDVKVFSAGTSPTEVHPIAIKVMSEIGVDISEQRSSHINAFKGTTFDYIITVCDHAQENCPVFPGKSIQIHKSFTDPAKAEGSQEVIYTVFRKVRDEINAFALEFFSA